jgi:hypothetical protein
MADQTIANAPNGQNSSPAGTEKLPLSGDKYITLTNVANWLKDLSQTLTNKTLTVPVIADFTNATHLHTSAAGGGALSGPQGYMRNGRINVTVASNNITVAIKTASGGNPSASDPVIVNIGGTDRTITAALSVTKNAGTNWMNLGSASLAAQEADLFCYIGYNATDGVVLAFSRIPWAHQYSDFSASSTNEKYASISTITNAAAGDYYELIGRFAATLSAGAGFTWTVPAFTAINLINKPIYESRPLTFIGSFAAGTVVSGTGTLTTATALGTYIIKGSRAIQYWSEVTDTTNGTGATNIQLNLPFAAGTGNGGYGYTCFGQRANDNKVLIAIINVNVSVVIIFLYDGTYPGATGNILVMGGEYQAA